MQLDQKKKKLDSKIYSEFLIHLSWQTWIHNSVGQSCYAITNQNCCKLLVQTTEEDGIKRGSYCKLCCWDISFEAAATASIISAQNGIFEFVSVTNSAQRQRDTDWPLAMFST